MTNRVCCVAMVALALGGTALAQDEDLPLNNWTAPPFWRATVITAKPGAEGQMQASVEGMTASVQSLPSPPLPFVAITPCRIVDTRVNVADGFHEPNFSDNETRTFDLPNSPDCTGLPATTGAWSLNVQFRPISQASYITLFPTGTTRPGVSTTVATPAGFTTDAAIVPAGTSGDIDVYCQYAGRVVIDINGYYGPQSVVTSLNTKTGDLTLAAGSNVTITPSTNTLTIASTGGPGGDLPAGSANQTLYSNGSGWLASSVLTNDGANVGISGNLLLPDSTGTTGVIELGGYPFLHNHAGPGADGQNTFVGEWAGNFTMGCSPNCGSEPYLGSYNTASGRYSLHFNATGYANTATGANTLVENTTGYHNTANGYAALNGNTTGDDNTAIGSGSLFANSTGYDNAAIGASSMSTNTTGYGNTASGAYTMVLNTTGYYNTAAGFSSLNLNTTGAENTATGFGSLQSNTTGSDNTASGAYSLYFNTTGANNTASGYASLSANTTGIFNTASGIDSLFSNTTGYNNTAVGSFTLQSITTGTYNTAIGYGAGSNLTTGTDNIDIGNPGGPALENSTIRIGDSSQTRTFIAGISGVTVTGAAVMVDSSGQLGVASSSIRFKQDVADMGDASSRLMKLRPVTFHYKTDPDGSVQYGLIAEEVEKVMPELVVKDANGQPETVAYHELPALLLNEIQKEHATIARQGAQLAAQAARVRSLEAKVARDERALATAQAQETEIQALREEVQALARGRMVTVAQVSGN
jgi:hypothetical protein